MTTLQCIGLILFGIGFALAIAEPLTDFVIRATGIE